jgi:hypothetical protein
LGLLAERALSLGEPAFQGVEPADVAESLLEREEFEDLAGPDQALFLAQNRGLQVEGLIALKRLLVLLAHAVEGAKCLPRRQPHRPVDQRVALYMGKLSLRKNDIAVAANDLAAGERQFDMGEIFLEFARLDPQRAQQHQGLSRRRAMTLHFAQPAAHRRLAE